MIVENLSVSAWEELASVASAEHEQNLARRNELTRRRATAALAGMMSGELDATREIDDQLAALEYKIAGHHQAMLMIRAGLSAAIEIQSADMALAQIKVTRTAAQRRAELAAAVDAGLESLAVAVTAYLDSLDGTRPDRAAGALSRAFWFQFQRTRNRPAWWRKCITSISEAPHSMASVAPLSATTDPAIQESDTLEAAALRRKQEAVAALESLTPAMTPVSGKTRSNRKIDALEIAA